jgi:hypothetical protein
MTTSDANFSTFAALFYVGQSYHIRFLFFHAEAGPFPTRAENRTCKINCKNPVLAVVGRTKAVPDGL